MPSVHYRVLKYHDEPEQVLIANTKLGGDNVHRGDGFWEIINHC